jgi:signal transduction histidine kinase
MKRLSERIEREHQFLTDAAHELKTPLVAVQINAHVLLSRCDPDTRARCADAEAGLRDGVDRATRMVHQLLALERTQAEPPATPLPPLDLGALVRDRLAAAVPLALQRAHRDRIPGGRRMPFAAARGKHGRAGRQPGQQRHQVFAGGRHHRGRSCCRTASATG